jgi:hypothetical protein
MSKTVSFVARDELAEWLESRADEQMKSVSSICQDIVAAEYRRQEPVETAKSDQTQDDAPEAETAKSDQTQDDAPEALESETRYYFDTKRAADAVRTQFEEHLSDDDDKRLKRVRFVEGTPSEVVKELERRSED